MYEGRVVGIRPLEPHDLTVLTKLANDPAVRQLVVGWDWPVPDSRQADWLEATWNSPVTRRFAVVNLATGETVGLTGLWDLDWHNRSALTAVKLDVSIAPKGAGSDTVMLVNAFAFYEVAPSPPVGRDPRLQCRQLQSLRPQVRVASRRYRKAGRPARRSLVRPLPCGDSSFRLRQAPAGR